jgi:hypothetical protein
MDAPSNRAKNMTDNKEARLKDAAKRALAEASERKQAAKDDALALELGGPKGLEPTRFGDWERKGITSDF